MTRLSTWAATLLLAGLALSLPAAEPPSAVELERDGVSEARPAAAAPAAASTRRVTAVDLLLVPDSTADRIMAFDPTTGNLVDADFIPANNPNLQTPKDAFAHADNASVLVVDQISDLVQRYSGGTGAYLGAFAPAGGVNLAVLDNATCGTYRPNGNLLVCVTGGTNQDTVAEFDATGTHVGNFIAAASGGLDGPFDVYFRAGDVLVSSINTDQILRYDRATGAFLGVFAAINNFPEQIAEASNGNVLVANFSGTQVGVVELTSAGALVGVYNVAPATAPRGVYELPNGNLLVANGTGVYEVSRAGVLVDTKITGVNAQYIERVQALTPVELQGLSIE